MVQFKVADKPQAYVFALLVLIENIQRDDEKPEYESDSET
jgi:hypothetical protein